MLSLPVPSLDGLGDLVERDRVFTSLFPESTEPRRLGRYIVLCTLGKGGMGTVLKAYDQSLDRQVAIKVLIHPHGRSGRLLERFEREAQTIARLRHPHIVQIFDYDVAHDGTPYLVMELLEGEDLCRTLQRTGAMPLRVVVSLIVQAARGLHAAHCSGIVHRDLKPANLFLSRHGGETTLKILDFGLATSRSPDPGQPGSAPAGLGTPAYMSPEQVRADPLDQRADLWSLAVVAYEALTGTSPFA
ncbi:MAG: serine/threonine protein kinase, partial [Myxococcales bacterium]|nr:serine/threonine protein kinase [Myxococcales bacterium]